MTSRHNTHDTHPFAVWFSSEGLAFFTSPEGDLIECGLRCDGAAGLIRAWHVPDEHRAIVVVELLLDVRPGQLAVAIETANELNLPLNEGSFEINPKAHGIYFRTSTVLPPHGLPLEQISDFLHKAVTTFRLGFTVFQDVLHHGIPPQIAVAGLQQQDRNS
jgi:hypothetical protein